MQLTESKAAMDKETQKNIDLWLSGSYDEATKNEIRRLQKENPEELIDSFYKTLEFGTGGLRGLMGVGTNRMNLYTVRAATQGLANYINKQPLAKERHKVLIGYDSRHHSREFAEETSKVLAANNIEVLITQEIQPVALVSFGVLHEDCIAGVMITASHNPPQYNGYKVWWQNGAQVLPPHDKGIIEEVKKIHDPTQVKGGPFPTSLIKEVGEELDNVYLQTIRDLSLYPGDNRSKGKNLKVVYTSLHGAGITIVPRALTDWGFSNVSLVEKQCIPDGNFPTVKSPNPEEPEALQLGIEQLKTLSADVFLATDPDSDRLAVVVMHHNSPQLLNGNETACLLLDHICHAMQESKTMPANPMAIKTIVTTELFKAIALYYKIGCLDVLTGFKYIGEKIAAWEIETAHPRHYLFGGEESYGYLYGTHARDKDAIICCALVCELALRLKERGKTLIDQLYGLYHQHGIFREKLLSMTFEGKEGIEKIKKMMAHLRENPPKAILNTPVTRMEDYLNRFSLALSDGKKEELHLPQSDVLRFWLDDDTKIVVRPSGTEPKIKVYVACYSKHPLPNDEAVQKGVQGCDKRAEEYINSFKQLLS